MRVPAAWREPLAQGRLLLLSPFDARCKRATADLAEQRNRFVAALADAVFVAHASPGGKTESLCREIVAWGKPLWTVAGPENENLLALGAKFAGQEEAPADAGSS
jgi:predicted Rossmann fold nucleotide-binding protein DprA/Smf involved in DNA uptake